MVALRDSAKKENAAGAGRPDLGVVTGHSSGDGNVPHGALLIELAEAVARWQWDEVARLRGECEAKLGADETSDAILVAAGFNGITRVADAIGIRLDQRTEDASNDFRAAIGIDAFAPEQKWSASAGAIAEDAAS